MQADSTGRGGRVDTPPSLFSGKLTLAAFVFLDANKPGGIVVTNIHNDSGNFTLALNEQGFLQATKWPCLTGRLAMRMYRICIKPYWMKSGNQKELNTN